MIDFDLDHVVGPDSRRATDAINRRIVERETASPRS
jgi:hypothetical protein